MTANDSKVLADIERWLEEQPYQESAQLIGAGYQASIRLVNRPGGAVIVKEARNTGPFAWLRRRSLRREQKAYRKLAGVSGIPHCFGLLNDCYLVLDYVAGSSLREVENELDNRSEFFAELLEVIRQMHRHGVVHGDLKRKDNILVGPGWHPFIVDFGTAHFLRKQSGTLRRWLFNFMGQTDYNAWIKRKYRRDYRNLSAQDQEIYRPLPLEAVVRLVRESWRKLTLRRLRKRLRSGD